MGEWKKTNLGGICADISYGYTASAKQYAIGPKFLRITDIVPDRINWNTVPFCKADAPTIEKYKLKNGDLVIARTGATTGYNKIIKNISHNAVYASYLIRYQIDKTKAYPYYIGHVLQSPNWYGYIDAIAGGSAQPGANAKELATFDILLPPLPEQKAIASVLSSLDDKIDLLHRQNKTLEGMAETLFRQWFIEEAKEDWEEGKLNDVIDFNPAYKIETGKKSPYLEMRNINNSTFHPSGWYNREFNSGMKFKNGDTLLARITPCLENGKTCFVDFLGENEVGWGSTEYIVMRSKEPYHPFISYALAKNKEFRDYVISSMSGSSGRQRAQASIIREYRIKIPSTGNIRKLNNQLLGILPKLKKNAKQIRTLEKLRDTLLPKLMSGEVRVKV